MVSLKLSWQDGVQFSSNENEAFVTGSGMRADLRVLAPELRAAMERLTPPGEDEELLAESILAIGTVDTLARWYYHIDQLCRSGLIRRSLFSDDKPLATMCPFFQRDTPRFRGKFAAFAFENRYEENGDSGQGMPYRMLRYVLSRFAYVRIHDSEIVLESPLAHARIILHDTRLMVLLGALAKPNTLDALTQREELQRCGLDPHDTKAFVMLLREEKIVEQLATVDPAVPHESHSNLDRKLTSWEFHDLLFHSRSRRGRSDGQFGGTYRLGDILPPPALKHVVHPEPFVLYRPDLERLERNDPPLAFVHERRRSLRKYANEPITARQLGEFLYRVARVKELHQESNQTSPESQTTEYAPRPFPSGGGLYELEFYIAVRACQDLVPGLYHYDPLNHLLERIDKNKKTSLAPLFEEAAASAGIRSESLQVLVILTSRFERIAWKYESIAYSLTLKHVGVVYQTMYLAATAMGLAPCALGCGDSDLFSQVAGTDYYVETSVGEFLLGSRESEVPL